MHLLDYDLGKGLYKEKLEHAEHLRRVRRLSKQPHRNPLLALAFRLKGPQVKPLY